MVYLLLFYYILYIKVIFDLFPINSWAPLRPISTVFIILIFLLPIRLLKRKLLPPFVLLIHILFIFILIKFARVPQRVTYILILYSTTVLLLLYLKKIYRFIGITLLIPLILFIFWQGTPLKYDSKNNLIKDDEYMFYEYNAGSIDASPYYNGNRGLALWYDQLYWKFTTDLPVRGHVIYRESNEKLPLVVVVHGNHLAEDYSHYGYNYLLKHLASSGFVVASVDQNFLNGNWTTLGYGLPKENDTRAYLLLEHIRYLIDESNNPESTLFNKIDTKSIGLVGHSRGGEAVAIAAAKSDNPAIKAIMSLSPTDRQFRENIYLENTSYLTIHGANDGDIKSFKGKSQYNRTNIKEGSSDLKASYYFQGVNHSQFNSDWGFYDSTGLGVMFYGKSSNVTDSDQRFIATSLAEVFFSITLKEESSKHSLLKNPYKINGFPDVSSIIEYIDSSYTVLYDFNKVDNASIQINSATTDYRYINNSRVLEVINEDSATIEFNNPNPLSTQSGISISIASLMERDYSIEVDFIQDGKVVYSSSLNVKQYIEKFIHKIKLDNSRDYEPQLESHTISYRGGWDSMRLHLKQPSHLYVDNIALISYQKTE